MREDATLYFRAAEYPAMTAAATNQWYVLAEQQDPITTFLTNVVLGIDVRSGTREEAEEAAGYLNQHVARLGITPVFGNWDAGSNN